MKKSILILVMSAFFLVGLTAMVTADPPDNTECKEICEVLVSAGVYSGNGACMSTCNTCLNPSQSAGNQAVCVCKVFDNEFGGVEGFGFKNFGECVKFLKQFF